MKGFNKNLRRILSQVKQTASNIQGKPMDKLKNQNVLHESWPKVILISTFTSLITLVENVVDQSYKDKNPFRMFESLILIIPLLIQIFRLSKIEDARVKVNFICTFLFLFQNSINIYTVFFRPEVFNGCSLPSFIIYLVLSLFIYYAQKNLKINFLNSLILVIIQVIEINDIYLVFFNFFAFFLLILERELILIQIAVLINFQKQILNTLPMGCVIYGHKSQSVLFANKIIEEKMQITKKDKDSKNNDKKRFSSFLVNYEQKDKMTSKLKRFFSRLVIKTEYQNKVINSDFNAKNDLWNTFEALSHTDKNIMQYKYCCKLKQLWCSKQPFNLIREDKVYFEVLINTGITYDQQNCFMVSIYDITSQFKFQQSQRMNLFKSKLLKSITHELRTRLNIVQGILELLQLKNLQKADLTNVHYAYNNCKIQSHIVGSIVDYNLLQDGNIEPKNSLKDVREVIQDLNKLFFEECEMKQIRIEIYFECFNYDLVTDIERLMQVLINIMSNAVKYTDENGLIQITVSKNSGVPLDQYSNRKNRLSVRVKEGELRQDKLSIDRFPILFDPVIDEILEGINYYVISIKDTGQGIPKEKLKMIENMFENNDNAIFSDDDKSSGFMLGLRSSCALLKFINNDFSQNWLKITSDCDYGTQIYMVVIIHEIKDPNDSKRNYKKQLSHELISSGQISPLMQYETDSQFRIQSENKVRLVYQLKINDVFIKKSQKCSCKHNEVMIVDDEPFNLLVLEGMLKIYGLKAQRANNGQEFIQLLKKKIQQCENLYCRIYRFVIMDYQMPILNGACATQQALAICRSQNRKDIIVIGCTAFSDQNDIQDLKTSGMKQIFIKPITKKKIQEMIEFADRIHAD